MTPDAPTPASATQAQPADPDLAEYAKRLGKTKQYVGQLVDAGEVVQLVSSSLQVGQLLDKAKHLHAIHAAEVCLAVKSIGQPIDLLNKSMHLHAIHAADSAYWPALVATMLKRGEEEGT